MAQNQEEDFLDFSRQIPVMASDSTFEMPLFQRDTVPKVLLWNSSNPFVRVGPRLQCEHKNVSSFINLLMTEDGNFESGLLPGKEKYILEITL